MNWFVKAHKLILCSSSSFCKELFLRCHENIFCQEFLAEVNINTLYNCFYYLNLFVIKLNVKTNYQTVKKPLLLNSEGRRNTQKHWKKGQELRGQNDQSLKMLTKIFLILKCNETKKYQITQFKKCKKRWLNILLTSIKFLNIN